MTKKILQPTKSSKEGFCGTKVSEKFLVQGAEAKIILDEKDSLIIKDRIKKSYRISELDEKIRKQRTKSEKKLLEKASKIINAPNPLPLKEWDIIKIPFIKGKKLSEHLDSFDLKKQKQICNLIGKSTAKLHDKDIIHGDLTTSNLILVENSSASQNDELDINKKKLSNNKQRKDSSSLSLNNKITSEARVYFIDFGLGFISHKIEDKAVDIHLLRQALEAKHFKYWQILFNSVIEGYKESKDSGKVLERLKAVEKRGRYKEN